MMRAFLMAGVVIAASVATAPAQAAFTVCNKASESINVAIAFETPQDVLSQGWWKIEPGSCTAVISTPVTQKTIYHYAMSPTLNMEWAGTYNFCTQRSPQFRIVGSMECEARNFKTTGFRQTDMNGMDDYTLDIIGPAPADAATPPAPAAAATAPVVTPATPDAATAPAITPPNATPEATQAATPAVTPETMTTVTTPEVSVPDVTAPVATPTAPAVNAPVAPAATPSAPVSAPQAAH